MTLTLISTCLQWLKHLEDYVAPLSLPRMQYILRTAGRSLTIHIYVHKWYQNNQVSTLTTVKVINQTTIS